MNRITLIFVLGALISVQTVTAQTPDPLLDTTASKSRLIEDLTYESYAGLPVAASKIYFTDSKFAFSGFGEASYTNYRGGRNRASEDLELYMTNLYRLTGYLAYKPRPWVVLYAEIFSELLHDGTRESEVEFFFEGFADFLLSEYFNVRVGTHQVQIGYLNNNDEPVLFYSVNRPDVERLIIPSQWIDLGVMTYGKIFDGLGYSLSLYQGLDSRSFNGGTWIRRGRADAFRFNFDAPLLNGQLNFTRLPNTTMSVSGVYTPGGSNQVIDLNGEPRTVTANTWLGSAFARTVYNNWTFMLLGTYGTMQQTDKMFVLTNQQVLGSEVYGAYLEVGYDLLPALRGKGHVPTQPDRALYRPGELRLPIFARYERLNSHAGVHPELRGTERFQTDLEAITVGVNFNTRRNVVLKGNYQFRRNLAPMGLPEGDRLEVGMGFIF